MVKEHRANTRSSTGVTAATGGTAHYSITTKRFHRGRLSAGHRLTFKERLKRYKKPEEQACAH